MKEPVWVPKSVVLAIHQDLLARFGGLDGVRDSALLDSALNRPKNAWAYNQADVFDLASEYALGIIKNHPFLDGNKRIGFMTAYIFLDANRYELVVPEEQVVVQTMGLAAGEISLHDYAEWLRHSCILSGRKK
jgi:death-on-curing protein